MHVEAMVLDGDEGLLQVRRDLGQRHVLPLLVEAEPALAVGGVEPGVADAARQLVHGPGLLPDPGREQRRPPRRRPAPPAGCCGPAPRAMRAPAESPRVVSHLSPAPRPAARAAAASYHGQLKETYHPCHRLSFLCRRGGDDRVLPVRRAAQPHAHACLDVACSELALLDMQSGEWMAPMSPATAPRYGTWGIDLTGWIAPSSRATTSSGSSTAPGPTAPTIPPTGRLRVVGRPARHRRGPGARHHRRMGRGAEAQARARTRPRWRALYRTFLDEAARREARCEADRRQSRRDARRQRRASLAALMGTTSRGAGAPFFAPASATTPSPEKYALYLSQSGLGLPDREFYLRDNFKPQKKALSGLRRAHADAGRLGRAGRSTPPPSWRWRRRSPRRTGRAPRAATATRPTTRRRSRSSRRTRRDSRGRPGPKEAASTRRPQGRAAPEHGLPEARGDLRRHAGRRR